jgi:hypothetical protein
LDTDDYQYNVAGNYNLAIGYLQKSLLSTNVQVLVLADITLFCTKGPMLLNYGSISISSRKTEMAFEIFFRLLTSFHPWTEIEIKGSERHVVELQKLLLSMTLSMLLSTLLLFPDVTANEGRKFDRRSLRVVRSAEVRSFLAKRNSF